MGIINKGKDNLFMSGFFAGLAFLPAIVLGIAWWLIIIRAIALAVIWGCLNVYLPQNGIWIWRRDIVEEFLRYFSLPITLWII